MLAFVNPPPALKVSAKIASEGERLGVEGKKRALAWRAKSDARCTPDIEQDASFLSSLL